MSAISGTLTKCELFVIDENYIENPTQTKELKFAHIESKNAETSKNSLPPAPNNTNTEDNKNRKDFIKKLTFLKCCRNKV